MRTVIFIVGMMLAEAIRPLKLEESSIEFYVLMFFVFLFMDIIELFKKK